MKISTVNSYMPYSNRSGQVTKQNLNNQAFKGYWDSEMLNVMKRSSEEMPQFGKIFHKCSEAALKQVTEVYNVFGNVKQKESILAYQKLKQYVDPVRLNRATIETRYNTLNEFENESPLSDRLLTEKEKLRQQIKELDTIAEQADHYYVTDAEIERREEIDREIRHEMVMDYIEKHYD